MCAYFECQRDLPGVVERLFPAEAALLLEHLLDAAAVHVFHRVKVLRFILAAAVIADDVRMPQPAQNGHLAQEAAQQPAVRGHFGSEHLDSHFAAVLEVGGEIDDPHPANAQLPLQFERPDAAFRLGLRLGLLVPLFVQAAPLRHPAVPASNPQHTISPVYQFW